MIINIKDDAHWRDIRRNTIGGSEISTLFSCCPYSTANELFHMKKGRLNDNFTTPLMEFGKAMEPIVAVLVADQQQWRLEQCGLYHIHPEHPHLGCTLDYFVVESEHGPGILEIKNVQGFAPDWTSTRAPKHVELQLQQQFLVVNAARKEGGLPLYKWGAIGSLHAGNPEDVRVMMRTPDPKIHAHIIQRADKFWSDLEKNIEPPLLGSQDYEHIAELFKEAEVIDKDIKDMRNNPIMDDMLTRYTLLGQQELAAKKDREALKAKILYEMLQFKDEAVIKATAGRTDNYRIEIKQSVVKYAPRPASESVQLRFTVKPIEDEK